MKHLIVFLNYGQSRLDNPVYRRFAAAPALEREATLLFLLGKLEERDLAHQVSELRSKDKEEDVTFHICSLLERSGDGEAVLSSIRLIRKLYAAHREGPDYPIFVYGQIPEIETCNKSQRRLIWNNLTLLNKAAADYGDCHFLNGVYLNTDAGQQQLGDLLFQTIQAHITPGYLTYDYPRCEGEKKTWVPIFGNYNISGIAYPEKEIRHHLHNCYMLEVMRCALPQANKTPLEESVAQAGQIAQCIPLATDRICLQEESFLRLNDDETSWIESRRYWADGIEQASQGLGDIHRQEWLTKIYQNTNVLYQSRFRQVGVEYFFKIESQKTEEYSVALAAIVSQQFDAIASRSSFTPDALKAIVQAFINLLQQRVIEIQQHGTELQRQIADTELALSDIGGQWNKQTLFTRLMGKDTQTLELYKKTLTQLLICKTQLPGCDFAVKLLNELITRLSGLNERCDKMRQLFHEAMSQLETAVAESNPRAAFGIFDPQQLDRTCEALQADRAHFIRIYTGVLQLFFAHNVPVDGFDFYHRAQQFIEPSIDAYLNEKIESEALPRILNLSIVDRVEQLYGAKGGFEAFMQQLQAQTQTVLKVKNEQEKNVSTTGIASSSSCPTDKYLLIAPSLNRPLPYQTFVIDDFSHLELLHLYYGITLPQLDGFSGQRVAIEPTIF